MFRDLERKIMVDPELEEKAATATGSTPSSPPPATISALAINWIRLLCAIILTGLSALTPKPRPHSA
ncbi:MAG: hypothetical protein IIA72_22245 [Proteobacteria bacterium]|nr:hypothetical protein [Pseudomonadota bacterium]